MYLGTQYLNPWMPEVFNDLSMARSSGQCSFPSSSVLLLVILPCTKSDQSPLLFSFSFLLSICHYNSLCWGVCIAFLRLCTLYQAALHFFLDNLVYPCFQTSSSQNCLAAPDLFPSILFHLCFFFLTSSRTCFAGILTWIWLNHNLLQSHQWIDLYEVARYLPSLTQIYVYLSSSQLFPVLSPYP